MLHIFSPHGTVMLKGLYFTTVVFFLSSLRSLNGSQKNWKHIQLWLLFEKFSPNSSRYLPPWAGGKNDFFGTDFEPAPNVSLQWNVISTTGKKLVNLQGLSYMPPNLRNFGPATAENSWRVFAHPLNFRIGRLCQPYHMDVNRQQANFDMCYVVAWA